MNDETNPKSTDEVRSWGKREKVICGKIPVSLHTAIMGLIREKGYTTINDFVEEAVFEKWKKICEQGVEGC